MSVDTSDAALWEEYVGSPTAACRERLVTRYLPLIKYVVGRMAVSPPQGLISDTNGAVPRQVYPCEPIGITSRLASPVFSGIVRIVLHVLQSLADRFRVHIIMHRW